MSTTTIVPAKPTTLEKLAAEGQQLVEKMASGITDLATYRAQFGDILNKARTEAKHGTWEQWVRQTFEISPQMAWKYIEAHRQLQNEPDLYRDRDFGLNAIRKGRVELPAPQAKKQPAAKPPDTPAGHITEQALEAKAELDHQPTTEPTVDSTATLEPPVDLNRADQAIWDNLTHQHDQIRRRWESASQLNPIAAEKQLSLAANEARHLATNLDRLANTTHQHT